MRKKSLKKVFSALMAAGVLSALVFSLAACSPEGGESSKPSTSSSATTSSKADTSSKEESKAPTNGKATSMQDYIDASAAELKTLKDTFESSGMKVDITGEDNKLIFAFKLNEQIDATTGKAALESALDQSSSTFETLTSSLKQEVDIENPVIVVKYLNKDGSELVSKEFTAK